MYSPEAKKVFIKLYEDAQVKLASAYGVPIPQDTRKEEQQNATSPKR